MLHYLSSFHPNKPVCALTVCASAYTQWHWEGPRKDKKGQSAGDRRQGGCEWKTRKQEVTEVRHQRVQLSDVHIFSHCRDHEWCRGSRKQAHEWFGESGRFRSRLNWQASTAKVDAAVSSATEPSVCRLVQSTQSKGEVRSERQQRACDIWADTQGGGGRGTLTGLRLCDQQKGREKRHLVKEWQISTSKHHTHQQQNLSRSHLRPRGGTDVTLSWMSGVSGTWSRMQ